MTTPTRLAPLLLLALTACRTQIQHGLEERDANEVVSALVQRGVEARKVPEKGKKPTFAVEVDDGRANEGLRLLIELKLPRPARVTTRALAEQTSLVETPGAERLKQLEAEEGDIEQALETMDGVTSAAVELVVPLPPRPGSSPSPSKASVLLRVESEAMERLQQQRLELRALVAAAVDGLKPDDVVLVLDPVAARPAPPEVKPVGDPLRPLVVGLGLVLSVLATALVVLVARLRSQREPAKAAEPPGEKAAPNRPVVSPSLQRKVA
jgi:type III secretion protein J